MWLIYADISIGNPAKEQLTPVNAKALVDTVAVAMSHSV